MTYKLAAWLCVSLATTMACASSHSHASVGGYVVRKGDNDWAIAHRLHISQHQLRVANPDVKWTAIQPGQHLAIPSGDHGHTRTVATETTTKHARSRGGTYVVQSDDNDWTISAKLGITNKVLRRLNPSVRWTRIHPGQRLRVPESVASRPIHRIETRYARINGDAVTLRRGPGVDHDKVTAVDGGTKAKILDRDHGWYKLRFPKGTVAWVRGDYLSPVHVEATHTRTYASRRRRHSRGTHSVQRHYVARYRRHGRTPELALDLKEVSDSPLVRTAVGYRGTPYSYGSASRHATDCSGLMVQVLKKHGVHLPRTAQQQSGVGERVGKKSLKKGDLVFFHTNRSARVNHVGMYIGNGKFIHASSGGGHVQVNSLNEGYYSRRFVGARRVMKAKPVAKRAKVSAASKDYPS